MSEILHDTTTNIGEWGNSLGVRIKKIYAELAGMDEKDTQITQAVIKGQHGIFIGLWLEDEQPKEIDNQDLKKLQKLANNGKNQ